MQRYCGVDGYRVKKLKEKVVAADLRLAYEKLRDFSAYRMVRDNDLLKACQRYWSINKAYVAGGADMIDPIRVGITLESYYRVLVKVDRVIRLSTGRDI